MIHIPLDTGLEDLGLFGIKLPKIKIGLPRITIRNKWVKRALIGAAGIISGGTLPYLARQGAIPGLKLGKEDKKLVNEFYRNAAIATGAAAAIAAAPAVLPVVGSAAGSVGSAALAAGKALGPAAVRTLKKASQSEAVRSFQKGMTKELMKPPENVDPKTLPKIQTEQVHGHPTQVAGRDMVLFLTAAGLVGAMLIIGAMKR